MMRSTPIFLQHPSKKAVAFMVFTAICGWFGVITQFYITITTYNTERTLPGVILEFISYFTIICNTLASFSLTAILLKPQSTMGHFFSNSKILSAIAFYMVIVGLIYNTLLRNLVPLYGMAFMVNEVLHVLEPLLYTIFWLAFVPKTGLAWNNALKWLWVPFIYTLYIMLRGALTGLYPYPFMNAGKYGYAKIAVNSIVLLLVFLALALVFVWLARLLSKKETSR